MITPERLEELIAVLNNRFNFPARNSSGVWEISTDALGESINALIEFDNFRKNFSGVTAMGLEGVFTKIDELKDALAGAEAASLDTVRMLKTENEYLRRFGNFDCTARADEALAELYRVKPTTGAH